ncbi:MAG: TIGR03618 family F420-dependent PPOX class oxidoreductase [Actinomycetota bacterium]|nr:TIGR03618 family F420-dependent PPOX class oxidoreductase [Actinomycetota bacterium]
MSVLTQSARAVIESDHLAHLVTLNPDGTPHVTIAWLGLDGNEIVIASLRWFRKLRNIQRDPRVSVSMEGLALHRIGLREYLVVYGTARIEEGGAADLLRRLARVYIGPDTTFPPDQDPPPGWITRITPKRLGGAGPWLRGE